LPKRDNEGRLKITSVQSDFPRDGSSAEATPNELKIGDVGHWLCYFKQHHDPKIEMDLPA